MWIHFYDNPLICANVILYSKCVYNLLLYNEPFMQWRIQDFLDGGANLLFDQTFLKNCMKMKEFGPKEVARPLRPLPLDPSMLYDWSRNENLILTKVVSFYEVKRSLFPQNHNGKFNFHPVTALAFNQKY